MFGFGKRVPEKFVVYDCGTDGNLQYELRVGVEIDRENAEKLSKIADGNVLYAVHMYNEGVKEQRFVSKEMYLKMKKALDSI